MATRTFSRQLFYDLYQDCLHTGYEGAVENCYRMLKTFKDQMKEDDFYFIFNRLSFCYYHLEWDSVELKPIYLRNRCQELWNVVQNTTDDMVEVWCLLLQDPHRSSELRYFGNRSELESLCRITR